MCSKIGLVILFCLMLSVGGKATRNKTLPRFPKDFKFGTATASYQIEGGWNADGKGENIWDHLTHTRPRLVSKCGTGDVACDSYHQYMRDIEMLQELGVDYYRFSIAWPRIMPNGFDDVINPNGLKYYDNLINELIARNITPFVTLYHWDLPQKLQELGGWLNPMMESIFLDYATVIFRKFGDRVKHWITFNEPKEVCYEGYEGSFAPALPFPGYGPYLCAHNVLKTHGRVYREYEKQFKPSQNGQVGITLSSMWFETRNPSLKGDVDATETAQQFELGWFANPIYSNEGDYPIEMKSRINRPGSGKTRLPTFTPEEIEMIKGSADFFGLNHYTTRMCAEYVEGSGPELVGPSYMADRGVRVYIDPTWASAESPWLKVVPFGMRKLLVWIKDKYNNPNTIVFENGYSDKGEVDDWDRVNYYRTYMTALLEALIKDKCNVTAYFAWSLMDNFEWLDGYTQKFGLYHVNFDDPKKKRTAKLSALVFKEIIRARVIDFNYDPPGRSGRQLRSYTRKPRSVKSGCRRNDFELPLVVISVISILKSMLCLV